MIPHTKEVNLRYPLQLMMCPENRRAADVPVLSDIKSKMV